MFPFCSIRRVRKLSIIMNNTHRIDSGELLQKALSYHQAGLVKEAEAGYISVLETDPDNADALHLLGVVALAKEDTDTALTLIKKAIQVRPRYPHFYNSLGEVYRFLKKPKEAAGCYEEAIAIGQGLPEPYNNLGIVFHEAGEYDKAIGCYKQALSIKKDHIEALSNLAMVLKEKGMFEEASSYYDIILHLRPGFVDAWRKLGEVFQAQGKVSDAIALYKRALASFPNNPDINGDMGRLLHEYGSIDEAVHYYCQALQLKTDFPEVLNNLGLALKTKGCSEEAAECFKQALECRQDYPEALNNLGILLYEDGRMAEAIDCFKNAVLLSPQSPVSYGNLGMTYSELGDVETALSYYDRSYSISSKATIKLKAGTILPVIQMSVDQIKRSRETLSANIDQLRTTGITIEDPVKEIGKALFYLAYQGMNDRDIQIQLCRLYRHISPVLNFVAPHCSGKSGARGSRKIKIGFVSRHLNNHTVGKYIRGIIANLSREIFEVCTFSFCRVRDPISRFIEVHSDSYTVLPQELKRAQTALAEQKLDIVFYPDIGMEPLTYFLAFSRLAPIQCVFYGHPVTTGIDTIDYFISHENCETSESKDHYSENLAVLTKDVTYTYFYHPEIASFYKNRKDFGFPDSAHLYCCPQSLFKIHPDFDALASNILNRDEDAILLLFNGKHEMWTDFLKERLRHNLKDLYSKVMFVPMQSYQDYMNVLKLSNVILDTPHFNGGGTTFDALAIGVPVVTLPGRFMRGRQTYGLYKSLRMMHCVAETVEQYAAIALRIGTDKEYRESIKEQIQTKNHAIFGDNGAVREIEHLLVKMMEDST
jgi:protein O-GlcNAc transferase